MKYKEFHELLIWQLAKEITLELYKKFSHCKDFTYKDQILRASISIMNNIAEGFERDGNLEFRRFIIISKGSLSELQSLLLLGKDLNYLNDEELYILYEKSISLIKQFKGLIKALKK
ncbi:MAG: four helix bundle protein [Leptospira sp.]|nr:four helix bundle protein [Leptospira sp.]